MNEQEIHRIRQKFILLSTLTLFSVMLLMGGFIYLFSIVTIRNEASQIMRIIAQNDGDLPVPSSEESDGGLTASSSEENAGDLTASSEENAAEGFSDAASFTSTAAAPESMSAGGTLSGTTENTFSEVMEWSLEGVFGIGNFFGETPDYLYTTRYFAVLFDEEDNILEVKTAHIAFIDETKAQEYALIALRGNRRFGNFGRYYYYCAEREDGGTIVIYLDRTAQIMLVNRVLLAALSILGLGTLLSFFFMCFFSRYVVRSEVENMEKQKQFITNASHELKTPLAVIKANTEMQEMLDGESEWSQSTLRQVDRMNGLIGNLVQIARAQERSAGAVAATDIAPAVRETADSFVPVAISAGKTLTREVPDSLILKADESRIRQLTSLLVDNAVKYCDDGGAILIRLSQSGKNAVLTVSNDYTEGADVDYTRFFERFYRQDEARTISADAQDSTSKCGYGIGLSIAESLVKSMNGSIRVSWKDGRISFTCRF